MITLITLIDNTDYSDRIASFCEREKVKHVAIQSLSEAKDAVAVMLITDHSLTKEDASLVSTPVCIIADNASFPIFYHILPTFSDITLRFLLDSMLHDVQTKTYEHAVTPTKLHKEFVVRNEYYFIDKIVLSITSDLAYFFPFPVLEKIRTGVSEILTNAVEHGNLGITADEKLAATEDGTYHDLLEQRMIDAKNNNKVAYVSINYENNELTVVIRDSGDGFDINDLPDPTSPDSLLKLHGRGLFISKMYFDELTFNDKGNVVTLYKKNCN